MMQVRHRGGGTIVASFAVALMLDIMPLPHWAALVRPEWAALVLIYWCMALPDRVGVGVGWTVGLLLDVMEGTLLGQYALGFAIIAFLTLKLHRRVRVFPLWQQALTIFLLIVLEQLLVLWIKGITGQSPNLWLYLLPSVSSTVIWPWVFVTLRNTRRRFQVT